VLLGGGSAFFVVFYNSMTGRSPFLNTLFQAITCLVGYFMFAFMEDAQPFLVKEEIKTYGNASAGELPRTIVYGQQPIAQASPVSPVYASPVAEPPTYAQSYSNPPPKN
jgi:hypothetical protein